MAESRTFLQPVVVAGGSDAEARRLAAQPGVPASTAGSTASPPARAGSSGRPTTRSTPGSRARTTTSTSPAGWASGAMAAAPLRAPGGEVIGTLAVSYREPGPISGDRLATLQALADHAAIALSNSDLLARLEASEQRYRGMIQSSPDLIFEMDGDGVYTFYSDRIGGGHRLAAGRAGRAPVRRVRRHVRVPAGGGAARRDRRQPRPPVDRPAPDPPQGRPPHAVRGERRRPGRRGRAGWRRSAASPATSASGSASSASCARRRPATGSSSRTRPTSCSASRRTPGSCSCPRPIEHLTGYRPDELVGESFTAVVVPGDRRRRLRPLERDRRGARPGRRSSSWS